MGNYRISVTRPSGGIDHVYEVNCDCDAAALHAATSMLEDAPIDIWHGDRWVAALDRPTNETRH